jgi:hypothetical protein
VVQVLVLDYLGLCYRKITFSCYTASDNWKLPVQVTGNHLDFTNKRGRQWITINSTKVLWNMVNPMWLMVGDRHDHGVKNYESSPHALVGLF